MPGFPFGKEVKLKSIICQVCGKSKLLKDSVASVQTTCSRTCFGRLRTLRALESRAALVQPTDASYRLVPLAKGQVMMVSLDDFEWASEIAWTSRDGYAYSGRNCSAHRHIAQRATGQLPPQTEVDHKNGDRLDNRRANLRVTTKLLNARNRRLNSNSKSGYKGVCLHKRVGLWGVSIGAHGQQLHVGYFETQEEAAWMRDQWAIELHGDFARLNFNYV